MWSSHPTQQDLLPSSGQLLSKVVPFLQMQHDTTGKVISQSFYQLMRFQSTEVQLENPNAILGYSYRGLWFGKSYNEIFSHPDVQMVSGRGINNAWRALRRPKIDTLRSHVRV